MDNLLLQNPTKDNMQLTVMENKQQNFFETTIGKAINAAINYGLKKLLPDFIEDAIIEIKDEIFKNGIIDGIKTAINKVTDLGKSAIGTITGTFNKISQIETSVEKGGIIDSTSKLIDKGIKNLEKKEILPENITTMIKEGKNIIKNDLKKNIKEELNEQKNLLKKIEKYSNDWKKAYEEKNLEKMEEQYNKIMEIKDIIIPIEEINKKILEIENINNLVKNKNLFNLSNLEIELSKKI